MITLELAQRLHDAGLPWAPAAGDRFVVRAAPDAGVFVLSDLTADVHDFVDGTVIGFNGTVEWALDSVALADVLWLPNETQLRERLGDKLTRLDVWKTGFVAELTDATRHADGDAECAYARALLHVLGGRRGDPAH